MAVDNVNLQVSQEVVRIIFDKNYKLLGFDECAEVLSILVKLQKAKDSSNQATTPTRDSGISK